MKKLLFVDDEERVIDALTRMLRVKRNEWECFYALSVDEALDIIAAHELDAIVSDVTMPGKSGLDLLRMVREQEATRFVPFLILTGNGDVATKREALELGASDFLNKPFDFQDLSARLQNAIALKSFHDEVQALNVLLEQRVVDRTHELEHSRREIIIRLALAAETRDNDTGNHIIRVGIVAKIIAGALGMDESDQERILMTAPLHDVGKIGIGDDVLRKPSALTPQERSRMQEHCRIGQQILTEDLGPLFQRFGTLLTSETDSNELLTTAAKIARHHHEWWDGSGYPDGLAGEAIPLEARITGVADVYDAMRSRRPYKPSYGPEHVLDTIRGASGTQFDPVVVDAFVNSFAMIEAALQEYRDDESEEQAA